MAKDKKIVNPAEQFRKQQKKKDMKKAQEQRKVVREVRSLLNDPEKIDEEIAKYQKLSNENKLDKGLKDKIQELRHMKSVALKKIQIEIIQGKRKKDDDDEDEGNSDEEATKGTHNSLPSQIQPPVPAVPGYPYGYAYPRMAPGYPAMIPGIPGQLPGMPLIYQPNSSIPPPPPPRPGMGMIPPRFGVPAPMGWNPQPLPRGPVIGGMNGIPPPPPRPIQLDNQPPCVAPAATPQLDHAAHIQQRRENKRKRGQDEFVDPLDPAAQGYTERFGKKPTTQKASDEATPPSVEQSAPESMLPMPLEEQQVEPDEPAAELEEMETQESTNQQPSAPFNPSMFASFTVNKEELLRRRMQIQQEAPVEIEVPEQVNDDEDDAPGPSLPPGFRRDAVYVEDVNDEEDEEDGANQEKDRSEESSDTYDDHEQEGEDDDDVVGPSRPPDMSSYYDYYASAYPEAADVIGQSDEAPRFFTEDEINGSDEEQLPAAVTKSSAPKPVLPGMEFYGDSDEDEEEQEDEVEESPPAVAVRPLYVNVISYPEARPAVPSFPVTTAVPPLPIIPPVVESPPPPAPMTSAATIAEMHQQDSSEQQNSSVTQHKAPLKVVKDSALTALVPNVLKKKVASKPQFKPASPPTAPPAATAAPVSNLPVKQPAEKKEDIDDTYAQFMAEIEGLGE